MISFLNFSQKPSVKFQERHPSCPACRPPGLTPSSDVWPSWPSASQPRAPTSQSATGSHATPCSSHDKSNSTTFFGAIFFTNIGSVMHKYRFVSRSMALFSTIQSSGWRIKTLANYSPKQPVYWVLIGLSSIPGAQSGDLGPATCRSLSGMLNPGPQPRPGESEPTFSQAPAGLQDIKCEGYQMDSENQWPSLHLEAQGTNFSFTPQRCLNRAQLTFPINFYFDWFFL